MGTFGWAATILISFAIGTLVGFIFGSDDDNTHWRIRY